MKPRNLLIEVFGQGVNANFSLLCPQIHLRQHLIGKRIGHHKRRVPGRAAEIDQTAFREQKKYRTPIWKRVLIDLRLDIFRVQCPGNRPAYRPEFHCRNARYCTQ